MGARKQAQSLQPYGSEIETLRYLQETEGKKQPQLFKRPTVENVMHRNTVAVTQIQLLPSTQLDQAS